MTTATSDIKQSRVGKRPVVVPSGVTVNLKDGTIDVQGRVAALLELGLEGHLVDGPRLVLEVPHRLEDGLVLRVVEVLDLDLVDERQDLVAEQDAAQDR